MSLYSNVSGSETENVHTQKMEYEYVFKRQYTTKDMDKSEKDCTD